MPKKRVKKGNGDAKSGRGFLDNALNVGQRVVDSGVLGRTAAVIDPRAGQVVQILGAGRKARKSKKGGNIRLMPISPGVPPFMGRQVEYLTASGRKKKHGRGWGDIVGNIVNVPASILAGSVLGASSGLKSGLSIFG